MQVSASDHPDHRPLERRTRSALKGHRPCLIWLTGLSGAGKTTLANLLEVRLHAMACHTYVLDGDSLRQGLCRDLGFSAEDRAENVRRVGEVGKLMVDAGLVVIAALISPMAKDRAAVRALFDDGEYLEVHVHVPLEIAEQRDPKGLYRRARAGELRNFTGVDAPYEPPAAADLRLDTSLVAPMEGVGKLIESMKARGVLDP